MIDSAGSASAAPAFVERLANGIEVVDTGFHRPLFDAAYLIVEGGRAAFVDTGTNHAVPRLLAALEAAGLDVDAVDYVIPTHVHLDHAGGAGLLMQQLPRARLVAHPRGARHLIDPVHLVEGATAVYGAEEIERSYGTLVPVPAERVIQTQRRHDARARRPAARVPRHARPRDASPLHLGRSQPRLLHRRYLRPLLPRLRHRRRPLDHADDDAGAVPARGLAALDRAHAGVSARSTSTSPTTAGSASVPRLAALLLGQLDEMVALARSLSPGPDRHAALMRGLEAIHLKSLRAHGVTLSDERIRELLALDLELNAQGIAIWLDRTAP